MTTDIVFLKKVLKRARSLQTQTASICESLEWAVGRVASPLLRTKFKLDLEQRREFMAANAAMIEQFEALLQAAEASVSPEKPGEAAS